MRNARDFARCRHEVALAAAISDYPRIVGNVCSGWDIIRNRAKIRHAADYRELTRSCKRFCNRYYIWLNTFFNQVLDVPENQLVFVPVKIALVDLVRDLVPRFQRKHQSAEDALLGLDVMAWDMQFCVHALQRLLSKRFGAIPSEITRLICNAPVETIERWFDLAIDAQQLSDIFKDE